MRAGFLIVVITISASAQTREEIATLKAQVAGLQSLVASLQTSNATLQSQIGSLQGQVGSLQTSNATLQSQVGSLQTNDTTLQTGDLMSNSRFQFDLTHRYDFWAPIQPQVTPNVDRELIFLAWSRFFCRTANLSPVAGRALAGPRPITQENL
jgi:hypothetical protein